MHEDKMDLSVGRILWAMRYIIYHLVLIYSHARYIDLTQDRLLSYHIVFYCASYGDS